MKKKLLKKYEHVIESLELEGGLIDDCKYMLYFKEEYSFDYLHGSSVPCRNLKEVEEFCKEAVAHHAG